MILNGQCAIVTGGSLGLGFEIASTFLAEGARVAICSRDKESLDGAFNRLLNNAKDHADVLAMPCDVSSEDQVEHFVKSAIYKFGKIDILINNAGVLGPIGPTETIPLAEWRHTFDINFFGVLLTCRALVPHFRSRNKGKIVNMSGGGATSPRPFFSSYATSKTAVVRLTENLAEELRNSGICVNAVAPGALNTRMLDETLAAGPELMENKQFMQAIRQRESGGNSIEKAVQLVTYLASSASDGITGKLISAPWDPWPKLNRYVDDLKTSDIYTLRRITPTDRSRNWTEE